MINELDKHPQVTSKIDHMNIVQPANRLDKSAALCIKIDAYRGVAGQLGDPVLVGGQLAGHASHEGLRQLGVLRGVLRKYSVPGGLGGGAAGSAGGEMLPDRLGHLEGLANSAVNSSDSQQMKGVDVGTIAVNTMVNTRGW